MRSLALLIVVGIATVATADVLPPGTRWANHVAVFEGIADHPDYAFFVWPRDLARGQPGNSSVRVGTDGEATMGANPMARGIAGGAFLVAVSKKLFPGGDASKPPEDDWFEGTRDGVMKVAIRREIRAVPVNDTREKIVTRYKVAVADGKLTANEVSHDEVPPDAVWPAEDAPRRNWAVIGSIAVAIILAAGLIVGRLNRKPPTPPDE